MKKIFACLSLAILLIFCGFTSPTKKAFAANISDNSVIILSGSVNEQNKLVIQANLQVNTGIAGMTLELSYNKFAMVLSNVVLGQALASLEPITTNTQTEQGYSITPFKFNYLSTNKQNDFSTGELFTLTFDLFDSIRDGSYRVSLKYEKNKDVNYYENGNVKTKNLYIDNAEIQIKNNSVTDIKSVGEDEQNNNFLIIALCIAIPAVIASGILVAIRLFKRKRNWKRI